MKSLTKKHLFDLLAIQSESGACESMADHITALVKKLGAKVESDTLGNLYVTKGRGDDCPAVVAHMDTVHSISPGKLVPIEIDDRVTGINSLTMRQSGIGGDDKCGVWAALRCIECCRDIKAAFFVDEEIGCRGSYACDVSFFSGVRFVLQADRRGGSDFVRDIGGAISSKAFQKAVAPYLRDHGYKFSPGGMTDVQALSESKVGVSCANLSAGYYAPHTAGEYIVLSELENTIQLMVALCQNLQECFPHARRPRPAYYHRLPAVYSKAPTAAQNMATLWADWETELAQVSAPDEWGPAEESTWNERDREYLQWYKSGRCS